MHDKIHFTKGTRNIINKKIKTISNCLDCTVLPISQLDTTVLSPLTKEKQL